MDGETVRLKNIKHPTPPVVAKEVPVETTEATAAAVTEEIEGETGETSQVKAEVEVAAPVPVEPVVDLPVRSDRYSCTAIECLIELT